MRVQQEFKTYLRSQGHSETRILGFFERFEMWRSEILRLMEESEIRLCQISEEADFQLMIKILANFHEFDKVLNWREISNLLTYAEKKREKND